MARTRTLSWPVRARAVLELRRRQASGGGEAARAERPPADWQAWLAAVFPGVFGAMAARHVDFWRWVWSVRPAGAGAEVRPRVEVWPRGGGKSTSAEAAVVALGAPRFASAGGPVAARRYFVYVMATQEQADKEVGNIGGLLESPGVGRYYPDLAARAVGKYGSSKGWRRNRLWTQSGLVVDALGLDTASRSLKVGAQRPDGLFFDDIDRRHDTRRQTDKKVETITQTILPIGTADCVVCFFQNLIIPDGVVGRLVAGRADFLVDRVVSGPHPAVAGLRTDTTFDAVLGRSRTVVVGGEATWAGQDLAACQRYIDRFGLQAFRRECQHEVDESEGALWSRAVFDAGRVADVPRDGEGLVQLARMAVAVDPSATAGGDAWGIVVGGVGYDGAGYLVEDLSGAYEPLAACMAALRAAAAWEVDELVVERNHGGDMLKALFGQAAQALGWSALPCRLVTVWASRGKRVRAEPVAALYGGVSDDGGWVAPRVHHVGVFAGLERECCTWAGAGASPNRLDALVWLWWRLLVRRRGGPVEATVL